MPYGEHIEAPLEGHDSGCGKKGSLELCIYGWAICAAKWKENSHLPGCLLPGGSLVLSGD